MPGELAVDHRSRMAMSPQDAGWMARLAALLVGEDPTQSYALICGNCHMHNGLARKEDFLVFTYYCPHCHALNKPRNLDESSTCNNSPNMRSLMTHHDALHKGDNASGTSTPDTKSPPTNRHHMNKQKKPGENLSDINIPNMKSSPTNRHRVNKLKKSGENWADISILDMKYPTVVNADLFKQSSESVRETLALDEKNAEDPDNH
ncbi:hypothetical protein M8C21_000227 [Ambrosia artemisiifolia]|uniref:Lunapark zinc ribbon domain-containing protein n=1 Tax=Ambrosia artemisiifolia TaxID=4212 RepID=A0AAD5GFV1_AMBAR|nr:hypothetical protein M8C21_000227 [Ambrosia artemisiifolia]